MSSTTIARTHVLGCQVVTATPVTSASSPSRATSASTCAALDRAAAPTAVPVRRPARARPALDGLVIPGGESTTMDKLVRAFDLREPLRARIADGHAGLRLVRRHDHARRPHRRRPARPADPRRPRHHRAPQRLRPAGRLVRGGPRLRRGRRAGRRCTPSSSGRRGSRRPGPASRCSAACEGGPAAGRIVAVRQGNLLATSFHPEVTGDRRVHELRPSSGAPADQQSGLHAESPEQRKHHMSGHSKWATTKHKKAVDRRQARQAVRQADQEHRGRGAHRRR